jgi:hypothetical protein
MEKYFKSFKQSAKLSSRGAIKRFMANALMICMILTAFACSKEDEGEDLSADIETESPYGIGDYYNVYGVKGVVFEVSNDGENGKIVSLDEEYEYWGFEGIDEAINANDRDNGMNNMNVIKRSSDWESSSSAFKWCDEKNADGITGWYYPAINELKSLYDSQDLVKGALSKYGDRLGTWGSTYSSSTEANRGEMYILSFNTGEIDTDFKLNLSSVRAIRKF